MFFCFTYSKKYFLLTQLNNIFFLRIKIIFQNSFVKYNFVSKNTKNHS